PDPRAHRQWLAKQRYRGAHALELPSLNGISYPLTFLLRVGSRTERQMHGVFGLSASSHALVDTD
ncbi:hypothetical protein NKJ81_32255, partial [Mesorhizobium sp. M0018]|uniref:hypothetical protein n=1 Tax=Mesorhizobium sp. M0018 TaxID=2956844 RepID=UPI003336FFCD